MTAKCQAGSRGTRLLRGRLPASGSPPVAARRPVGCPHPQSVGGQAEARAVRTTLVMNRSSVRFRQAALSGAVPRACQNGQPQEATPMEVVYEMATS